MAAGEVPVKNAHEKSPEILFSSGFQGILKKFRKKKISRL